MTEMYVAIYLCLIQKEYTCNPRLLLLPPGYMMMQVFHPDAI